MHINRRHFLGGATAAVAAATMSKSALGAQFRYKLGHSTPADHPFSKRLVEASAEILEKTSGRLNIQVFPNSQLGGDNDLLSQVRSGAVEFFPAAGLILASVLPVTAINGMGFAFPNYDKVWEAVDGDLGNYVHGQIGAKTGLVAMSKMWDLGYRQVTNSARPINTAADLNGLKLRVPGAPPLVSLFQGLGVAPVSMQFGEIYTALQTKVVDGQENPLSQIDIGKFYEVQKYMSLTNHVWDGFWIVANGAAWKRLPEDVQNVANAVFSEKAVLQRADLVSLNKSLVDQLKGKGLAVNTTDTDSFRSRLKQSGFYANWRKQIGDGAWTRLEHFTGPLG
ncbi:TRAP transporter substrate-binding protein [Rhizobium laguerreae]|uniref:TRAP transporter substrate-binding protein n=1 Tax=Rhizobium laguerreae TaxID=1076926 RepID=UPI001C916959|nr:TRAP transporter substrate-binding protein [Rhizobium laguerreae]MBY3307587.1 TRAP transporter substrate-binding protein [Rhizobium laguerreae]